MPDEDTIPVHPKAIDPARLLAHLRDNPLMALYLRLSPERRAVLAGLATLDPEDDEAVAQELVASIRPSTLTASEGTVTLCAWITDR